MVDVQPEASGATVPSSSATLRIMVSEEEEHRAAGGRWEGSGGGW